MTIRIGVRRLQRKLDEVLEKVGSDKNIAVVNRWGKPFAAIIPMEIYQKLLVEREARFKIIEKNCRAQPDISLEQTMHDVQAAIARARKQRSS